MCITNSNYAIGEEGESGMLQCGHYYTAFMGNQPCPSNLDIRRFSEVRYREGVPVYTLEVSFLKIQIISKYLENKQMYYDMYIFRILVTGTMYKCFYIFEIIYAISFNYKSKN